MLKLFHRTLLFAAALWSFGCQQNSDNAEIIRRFPIDTLEGILTRSCVSLDKSISSDGNGSLKIDAFGQTTVRLFEINNISIEDARLIYKARIRTKEVRGPVYLEMRSSFPGLGEYYSRSMNNPVSGTVEWTTVETPFLFKKGQKPDLIKLNVAIEGRGTIWIDDILLVKGKL